MEKFRERATNMAELKRIEGSDIAQAVKRLVGEIATANRENEKLVVVGIADGGIDFAERIGAELSRALGRELPVGTVDIVFQRDDIGRNPIPKSSNPTELPFDITDTHVLLCDDVLCTGRTVRAALNELFDQGRPASVQLVVLFDRGNRRLPFQADFCGLRQSTRPEQTVAVLLDNKKIENDAILISEP